MCVLRCDVLPFEQRTLITSRGVVRMTTQLPAHAPAMMSWDSGMSRRGEGEEGLRMRIGKTLLRGEGGRGGEWWGGSGWRWLALLHRMQVSE